MSKHGSSSRPTAAQVNRGNQLNPSHSAYAQSRGATGQSPGAKPVASPPPTPTQVNRTNQLNPSHDAYWQSRGNPGRPEGGEVTALPWPPLPGPTVKSKG